MGLSESSSLIPVGVRNSLVRCWFTPLCVEVSVVTCFSWTPAVPLRYLRIVDLHHWTQLNDSSIIFWNSLHGIFEYHDGNAFLWATWYFSSVRGFVSCFKCLFMILNVTIPSWFEIIHNLQVYLYNKWTSYNHLKTS